MKFSEHGQFKISTHGSIIFALVKGGLNRESIQHCVDELNVCIELFENSPFSMLLDLTGFEGGTPEVWQQIQQFNTRLAETPLVAKAIVCKSMHITYFAQKANRSLMKSKIRIFRCAHEALSWLEETAIFPKPLSFK